MELLIPVNPGKPRLEYGRENQINAKQETSIRAKTQGRLFQLLLEICGNKNAEQSICTQFVCPNPDNKKGVCGINKLFIDFKNLTIVCDGKGVKEIW